MSINKRHIGIGVVTVVVIAGASVWLSGGLSSSAPHEAQGKPQAACTDHGCGDAGQPHEQEAKPNVSENKTSGCSDHDGHNHGGHAQAHVNVDPGEIEKARCEHDIRQLDCNECRYELGVVKVDPSVTGALTKTVAVQKGNSGTTLNLTGEVQYDQTTLVDVLPPAAGKVSIVKARLGQKVEAGEVLAVIHSGDFGEAKATYIEAQATADVAQQEKSRQVAISEALEKLLISAKAQPVSSIPSEMLGEVKSRLVGAVARLHQARIILEREKSLIAKQASSKAELETADREMQTAEADYQALIEEIHLNVKLDRLKADNSARLADARLNASQQRLRMFGLSDEAIAAIIQMKDNGSFAELEVKAPRAGIITAINTTAGQFVETSQSLYTIADTSNLWVWCDLYERDLGGLHEFLARGHKPKANIKVAAFADIFSGEVDLLDTAVSQTTRTIKVRVQVENADGKLRPGMFASVDVPLTDSRQIMLVPRQAVLSDEGQAFAFIHWKEDLWLRRAVTVGKSHGDMVEVLSGLLVGEKVVAVGGFLFKSDVLREKMGAGCAD